MRTTAKPLIIHLLIRYLWTKDNTKKLRDVLFSKYEFISTKLILKASGIKTRGLSHLSQIAAAIEIRPRISAIMSNRGNNIFFISLLIRGNKGLIKFKID